MSPEDDDSHPSGVDYESQPLSRAEYVTALSHFYRAEMNRTLQWRARLDTTTNWAVLTTVGILTFSFNNPQFSQETLIVGMYANFVFLLFEARRFRFFDLWRARVRMLEENFYGPILRRDLHSTVQLWGEHVADDLLHPKFKITMPQAIKARLLRNYIYVFGFLLLAWVGRVLVVGPSRILDLDGLYGLFGIGGIPPWVPIILVIVLYGGLLAIIALTPQPQPPELSYWPDPQHSGKDVPSLDV